MTLDRDIEMNRLGRTRSPADVSSFTAQGDHGLSHTTSLSDKGRPTTSRGNVPIITNGGFKGRMSGFIDSFRRDNSSHFNHHTETDDFGRPAVVRDLGGERYYDIRSANNGTASNLLARELKNRHLQMIAISGSIGTGLFVASGRALSQGGPAAVILVYLLTGGMLWVTMQALGEMAVVFPVAGSFSAYSTRFLDPSWGFAMGWK